ncbi:unnamed protein product [Bursaphelenchus xylophilus]|uniref:(pine wood nematode) hypothetical protein n=1 Tax=Bursaphelenchus xylophilus TaxID=6326 RepID=A0A1I7S564_BURXY|nr:unnamed protein product [Bursaphelenchus xylophilus]CAG9117747.1 unnamed protein product [Bursaphelenchus xylophilus]
MYEDENLLLHNESCKVVYVNPFHQDIIEIIREDRKTKPKCTPRDKIRSSLVNGNLFMDDIEENERCYYKIIIGTLQGHPKPLEWEEFGINGAAPQGDFVHVQCRMGSVTTYDFVHHQIYKDLGTPTPKISSKPNEFPDVHVLAIDSAAMPHVRRALPKTLKYITEQMGAISFPFQNKVQADTVGNSRALLFGNLTEPIETHPDGETLPYIERNVLSACSNDSSFLLRKFKEKGYKTLLSEDWSAHLLMACKENQTSPVDHFMTVYFDYLRQNFQETQHLNIVGPNGRSLYHSNVWPRYCRERHFEMFNYLDNFIDAYKEHPKFTVTWLGYLMHDWRGDLYMYDDDFLEFFKSHKFENSHFFLIADHGNRIYSDKSMFWDRTEDYNPVLVYIPPKRTQNNEKVMNYVRTASKQLVTQLDVYATLYDILENGFLDQTEPLNLLPSLLGSSFFRPLKQPRNCDSLGISYKYCLCDSLGPRHQDPELGTKLAQTAVNYMNNWIKRTGHSDICTPLEISKSFTPVIEEYMPGKYEEKVYVVTFQTFPGNALYNPFVQVKNDGTMAVKSTTFPRRNTFSLHARCVFERYGEVRHAENYCFCKSLLNDTLETNKVNL